MIRCSVPRTGELRPLARKRPRKSTRPAGSNRVEAWTRQVIQGRTANKHRMVGAHETTTSTKSPEKQVSVKVARSSGARECRRRHGNTRTWHHKGVPEGLRGGPVLVAWCGTCSGGRTWLARRRRRFHHALNLGQEVVATPPHRLLPWLHSNKILYSQLDGDRRRLLRSTAVSSPGDFSDLDYEHASEEAGVHGKRASGRAVGETSGALLVLLPVGRHHAVRRHVASLHRRGEARQGPASLHRHLGRAHQPRPHQGTVHRQRQGIPWGGDGDSGVQQRPHQVWHRRS
mmetsp:Transcript_12862/g.37381  ORF Transcript_12862/g.37381 Transcript_12862/m.37381 type:complete len:287 (-) Transcript_12862:175-1035(-)